MNCVFPCKTCVSYSDCDTCEVTTYDSDGFGLCLNCIANCLTCNNSLNCTTCIANMQFSATFLVCQCIGNFYYNNDLKTCVTDCPVGTFKNLTSKICQTCPNPCRTCTDGISCDSCLTGYTLKTVTGPIVRCACNNGYWKSLTD